MWLAMRMATDIATRLATDIATRLATDIATRLATDIAMRMAGNAHGNAHGDETTAALIINYIITADLYMYIFTYML